MGKLEKVVVLSIHKQHDDNIGNGSKKFEGRTKKLPLDAWIYLVSTKSSGGDGKIHRRVKFDSRYCYFPSGNPVYNRNVEVANDLCISAEELIKYFNGKLIYCHHISKVEVFEKPKELGEFYRINKKCNYYSNGFCGKSPSMNPLEADECFGCPIIKVPQSFQYAYAYIEEIKV